MFKNEVWCLKPAYVDKLSKHKNEVKHLIVGPDLFSRTVDEKRMKTEDSKETVREILTKITKKNRTTNFWVDKATEFAGEFIKLCKAEGTEIYSTISETKAPFAERTL